ncbi:undecaprenyldiphospho-muramoylpentapeptide beta-N-acetylglucosaminyltransferase [Croceibacterium sp. TMG7-5b_MA50]|uniref:undecaprenyldiphospho-muramoylpentapeptide beta-N-acetylglucosaminyltransferase n=1 Tax=Croceibacterium sp. TMG7-5b_MA50 TaxID=3121290 RepID=UPI0032215A30
MTAPGGESPIPGIVSRHFVLVAGGTGGHLTPAYALAQELERRGHQVALITDARGAAIPGKPDFLPAQVMAAGRFTKNPLGWGKAMSAMLEGRRMARALYKEMRPTAVVGFGGYPALPALVAANHDKIPTVIHEQNAVLGRVNRLLARGVDAIAIAYDKVGRLDASHAAKVHVVGNPVRPAVLALRDEPYPQVMPGGPVRLLVTGGSQGARVLSDVVPQGLALLPAEMRDRLHVTQQCRPEDLERVRAFYADNAIAADLASFFTDMDARLATTHLFIGRAGASTIAELSAAGRPAILIPLPIATDDHQAANAAELAAAGGARSIRQHMFTPAELARQMAELLADPEGLAVAAHAAWNCGRPDAARDLADLVEGFGGTPVQDVIRVAPASAPLLGGAAEPAA